MHSGASRHQLVILPLLLGMPGPPLAIVSSSSATTSISKPFITLLSTCPRSFRARSWSPSASAWVTPRRTGIDSTDARTTHVWLISRNCGEMDTHRCRSQYY
ncbi:hypothetical protein LX36DRAFT_323048 [Colletotrichum falcatum]|nr:hypothetical protein LX36DRAFT_323048 [Colletotrichum falcatum]